MKEFKITSRIFDTVHNNDGTNLKVVFYNLTTHTSITARFNVLLCDVKKIDKLIAKGLSKWQFKNLIKHAVKIEKVSTTH